jgi:hypothetical protein
VVHIHRGHDLEIEMNGATCCFGLLLSASFALAQDPNPSSTAEPRSAEPLADGTSEFNLLDVDRDGWLSESEVKAHPQPVPAFALIDRDADGKVSTVEWAQRNQESVEIDDD